MKKILILILCFLVVGCLPLVAFAEDVPTADEEVASEETTEEAPGETENLPAEDETVDVSPDDPAGEGEGVNIDQITQTLSGAIKEWIEPNADWLSVVFTLICYGIALAKKFKKVNASMGTMNHNSIEIAKDSSENMTAAREAMQVAAKAVTAYDTTIKELLEQYKNSAEDKKRLEAALIEMTEYLKVSAQANSEFADELAELLGLSNIPNFKKEEIGQRHLARVKALAEAEEHARHITEGLINTEEVIEDVGEET